MKIGWSTWEPGLVSGTPTSAGGAAWTRFLFNQFKIAGHNILMLQGATPTGTEKLEDEYGLVDLDIAFFCWRWSMPEYPDREHAYRMQMRLIKLLSDYDVPIVVHDQDHKISREDREFLLECGALITAPQFGLTGDNWVHNSLFFPNPYGPAQPRFGGLEVSDLTYVGNNYERFDQTVLFIAPFSTRHRVDFWGNWLEAGPNREPKEEVIGRLPGVNFHGRARQDDVIAILSRSNSTIHLAKESYLDAGFLTIRWAEAVTAGIPAFIPAGMELPQKYVKRFNEFGLIVEDGEQMVEAFSQMRELNTWNEAMNAQRDLVSEYMTTQRWFDIINLYGKGV